MGAMIHIDGGQHAATIEAMATAIVQVLDACFACRMGSETTRVALNLLNRAGFAGPTTISSCQFTNNPVPVPVPEDADPGA